KNQINRYWTPQYVLGYTNLTFEALYCTGTFYENRLPNSVINTAIAPENASQSIYVLVNFPSATPQSAYIVLYFYQNLDVNGSRTQNVMRNMDIYIDGVIKGNVRLVASEVLTIYPVTVQGTSNLTISPADRSRLPPLLNAMEVFIATQLSEQTSEGFKFLCLVFFTYYVSCLCSALCNGRNV
ncbi:hypothetical protein Pfo_016959, partial [Paulownia fortunei]